MAIVNLSNLVNKTAVELTGTEQIFLNDSGVAKDVTVTELKNNFKEDFAASSGASLVGYMPAGVGAVPRTTEDELRDSLSVFNFMPQSVVNNVKNRTQTADVTSYVQAALNHANLHGKDVFAPAGYYPIVGLKMKAGVRMHGEKGNNRAWRNYPVSTDTTGTFFAQYSAGDLLVCDYDTVRSATVESIMFHGGNFSTGRGIAVYPRTYGLTIKNCTIQMFPEQGLIMAGQICTVTDNFLFFNCQYRPDLLTFYKGGLEIYGGDNFIERNEVQGPVGIGAQPPVGPVPLVNANGYAVACVISSYNSWICKNLFEIADFGVVFLNTHIDYVSSDPANIYGLGVCIENSFKDNRVDLMRGHAIVIEPVSPAATPNRQGPRGNRLDGTLILSCGLAALTSVSSAYYGIYEKAGTEGFNSALAYPVNNLICNTIITASAYSGIQLRYGVHNSSAFALQDSNSKSQYYANIAAGYSVYSAGPEGFYDSGLGYLTHPLKLGVGMNFPASPASSNSTTLDCYSEGTVSLAVGGIAEFTSITASYTAIGNICNLFIPRITGTNNATSISITFPAGFIPIPTLQPTIQVIVGGVRTFSYASHSTQYMFPKASIAGASWSGSGTVTIEPISLSYQR